MLPKEYQEMVLQSYNGGREPTYEGIRDYVINVAQQKLQMRRPNPLEVNAMDWEFGEDRFASNAMWGPEIDAIDRSSVQCYACGRTGHLARECHSKGKGKGMQKGEEKGIGKGGFQKGDSKGGEKGKGKGVWGKGFGKGGRKGDMWSHFPAGKGYQGVCWNCHKVGHKASECRGAAVNEIYQQDVEQDCGSVEVGRVWNVCQLEIKSRYIVLCPGEETQGDEHGVEGCGGEDMPAREDWIKVDRSQKNSKGTKQASSASTCHCKNACKEGEAWACAVESVDKQICLGFQVADVKKPLISVRRIVEKGNHVSFGPKAEDKFIVNKNTGDKLMIKPNGKGSYLMQVRFVNGEETEITVDSGAEENVCP